MLFNLYLEEGIQQGMAGMKMNGKQSNNLMFSVITTGILPERFTTTIGRPNHESSDR